MEEKGQKNQEAPKREVEPDCKAIKMRLSRIKSLRNLRKVMNNELDYTTLRRSSPRIRRISENSNKSRDSFSCDLIE